MTGRVLFWLFGAVLTAGSMSGADSLSVNDIQLIDCTPVSTQPCFRASVLFGKSLPVTDGLLLSNTAVEVDGLPAKLFYLSTKGQAAGRKPRTVMILLDISGSMNTKMSNGVSRHEVAKQAVARFAGMLDPDVDQLAVVPFDNHDVVRTIRGASFVPGGEDTRALLASIPPPRGDTALYAAVYYAIDVLERRMAADGSRQYQLIVITDGKDDLGRDPDPELRRSPISLDAVAMKAEASAGRIDVYPIGIGGPGDTDLLAPLERISVEHSHMVEDPNELIDILAKARPAPVSRMQIGFLSSYTTLGQLQGRNHRIRVVIGKPGEAVDATGEWAPVESMMAPQARLDCTEAEKKALSRLGTPSDDYTAVARPLATLAVFGCILALGWFAMPRLIWPENYAPSPTRMESVAPPKAAEPRAAAAPGGRQETDRTYVLPREQADSRTRFK